MSGPKVVRIITREELINICRGHVAHLEAAVSEWERIGKRNNCVRDDEIAAVGRRYEEILGLFAREQFAEVQKQALQEIAFLERDLDERLAKMVTQAAAARSAERRQAETASSLLAAIAKSGKTITPELQDALKRVTEGVPDAAALSAGFALLSTEGEEAEEVKTVRNALASRHGEGLMRQSFLDWSAAQKHAPPDPILADLDHKLAELRLIAPDKVEPFAARLKMVEAAFGPKRGLLTDSLSMDLGRTISDARAHNKAYSEFVTLAAELKTIDPVAGETILTKDTTGLSVAVLAELVEQIKSALVVTRSKKAAELRRAAILTGLAALGYEVTEGMATGWVEDGRLVVRSAVRPDYGLEIGGDLSSERMQMRAVAFSDGAAATDRTKDTDAEALWCGDVMALQEGLAKTGGGLVIERALAIGATPLKRVVGLKDADRHRAREGPAQQVRKLR